MLASVNYRWQVLTFCNKRSQVLTFSLFWHLYCLDLHVFTHGSICHAVSSHHLRAAVGVVTMERGVLGSARPQRRGMHSDVLLHVHHRVLLGVAPARIAERLVNQLQRKVSLNTTQRKGRLCEFHLLLLTVRGDFFNAKVLLSSQKYY